VKVDRSGEVAALGPAVVVVTSDAGSDQAAATRKLAARAQRQHIAVIGQLCLQHQVHLVVQRSLLQGGRAHGRLAMLAHLWRQNARKFAASFEELLGSEAARRCASVPPAPLKGRWGSAHDCELAVLRASRVELLRVCGA
jgi:hypothetical protein